MKSLFLFFIFSSLGFSAMAQKSLATDSITKRFYAGLELSSISYGMFNYDTRVGGTFTPFVHLNVGYRLSKRLNVQVGLSGGKKENNSPSIYYKTADTTIYMHDRWSRRGIVIPLTVAFTPFNPGRRLNFYATASFVPVFGEMDYRHTETFEGETKETWKVQDSGVYLIGTAGLVLNYKISKRFEGYGKANLLYRDLGHYNEYAKRAKSIAFGLNYNL